MSSSVIPWLPLRPAARALPPSAKSLLLFNDNTNSALLSDDIRDQWGITRVYTALCDRATYVHLGRTAAISFAASTPRPFDARQRLVMAPISCGQ